MSLLEEVKEVLKENVKFKVLSRLAGIEARRELINDHSIKHFEIVANFSLQILRALKELGVKFDIECSEDEREVIVYLSAMLHDIGMALGRHLHEVHSTWLSKEILEEVLPKHIDEERRYYLIYEILNIISNHRTGTIPSTLEGEIVRLADALDIAEGRAKLLSSPPEDLHKISAEAIKKVFLSKKEGKIKIEVEMKNAAGMFLVVNFLRKKIGPRIGKLVEIIVKVHESDEEYTFKSQA